VLNQVEEDFLRRGKIFHILDASTVTTKGHFAKDCPQKSSSSSKSKDKGKFKGKGKRKHHAYATNEKEHKRKRSRVDTSSSDDEFVFVSGITGTLSQDDDVWLIDSGASKHMTGCRTSIIEVKEKKNSSL